MFARTLAVLIAGAVTALTALPAFALDINVSDFKLANGMEVVVIPDHRAPIVTHMVWYRVGAADEPQGKAGIAHFLEHLMFKGTPKHPAGDFSRIVHEHGGEENAFTTQDYTAFFQNIAKEQLGLVMELEADRMQNLVLTEANVKPELQVVLEERRMRVDNDPSALLGEQMDAALYVAHPYHKPVIGWLPEVSGLTLQDALDFYHRYYEPANAVLVVAGDVTADEVKALAEKYYGPLKNTAPPNPRIRTPEPPPIAERRVILRDDRATSPVWQRRYLAPAEDHVEGRQARALDMLASILGGGNNSRLYRQLVVEQQLAAYAGSWYNGDALDYGSFALYAAPNPGVDPAKLEAAIDAVIEDIKTKGVSVDELNLARNASLADTVYLLDRQSSLARVFGTALSTGQSVAQVLKFDKDLDAVTADDIKAAAQQVLQAKASVTGLLLPTGKVAAGAITPPPEPAAIEN
jgi:zinc protease